MYLLGGLETITKTKKIFFMLPKRLKKGSYNYCRADVLEGVRSCELQNLLMLEL